jgi:ubiquitin-protein ligase E3 C
MFSTFTGNSRRPRNVNLSGQAGNPFTNTSWSPSTASSATKTVSNAQADREKRHAERQRLRAAHQIQRTWRGHRERQSIHEAQRESFDKIYDGSIDSAPRRLSLSSGLLLSFFTARRNDDRHRLLRFAQDCSALDLKDISLFNSSQSRVARFLHMLLTALRTAIAEAYVPVPGRSILSSPSISVLMDNYSTYRTEFLEILRLAGRVLSTSHSLIIASANDYFGVLAMLCQMTDASADSTAIILQAFSKPFLLELDQGQWIDRSLMR